MIESAESLQYYNHSFAQITEQPRTDSGSPLLSSPIPPLATPLLFLPAHCTNITLPTKIYIPKQKEQ